MTRPNLWHRRLSKAQHARLAANVRAARRETIYRMEEKKHNGVVPCFVCGQHVEKPTATLEHIVPRSKGGTDDMGNLAISHRQCNQQRGNSEVAA